MALSLAPEEILVAGGEYLENVTIEHEFTLVFTAPADFGCQAPTGTATISGPAAAP